MEKEMLSLRTAVFLAADALLAELQRGASVTEINVGDKVSLRQDDNSVSLLVGDVEVVTTGEIENYVLFHQNRRGSPRL